MAWHRTRSLPQGFFETLENRLLFSRVVGADVSLFQGTMNWNTFAASGREFAFVRSSRTNLNLDANFQTNMANATAAGVFVGPYHRALPKGESEGGVYTDPVTDARRFVNAAGAYMDTGYLRPVLDIEDGYTLGKAALSQWVNDFCAEVFRLKGVDPIIYCNTNYATNYLDTSVSSKHDLWLARWNGGNANLLDPQTDQPETPSGYPNPYGAWNVPVGSTTPSHDSWDFWQYTSRGNGPTYGASSTYIDLDVYNGDLSSMKYRFQVGYQKNFKGSPFAVGPGIATTIPAEDYDIGGEGVSYHDTTPTVNTGGVYRTSVREGVEVKLIANTANSYRLGDAYPGEWVEYTINVAQAGTYKLDLRLSQSDPNAQLHVALDGTTNLTGAITVPDTNSFSVFTTVSRNVNLPAGQHVLRLAFDAVARNGTTAGVDWLRLAPAAAQQQVTIATDTATYVRGGSYSGSNFGHATELVTKKSGSTTNRREAYLKFDLSSVSSITGAKLRLYGRLSDSQDSRVGIRIYSAGNTSWNEDTLTWNNRPATGSTVRGAFDVSGTSSRWYEIDLTSFLKSEKAAGRNVVTLVLKGRVNTSSQALFASDEVLNGPQLLITT